jgi:hypothetical protein
LTGYRTEVGSKIIPYFSFKIEFLRCWIFYLTQFFRKSFFLYRGREAGHIAEGSVKYRK